jgi:hypothetical protein
MDATQESVDPKTRIALLAGFVPARRCAPTRRVVSLAAERMLDMSAVSDFLTQPGFWWGVPPGAVVTGVVAPIITARSVRASDKRKADQERAMDDRKAEREDLRSNRQILREAANASVRSARRCLRGPSTPRVCSTRSWTSCRR